MLFVHRVVCLFGIRIHIGGLQLPPVPSGSGSASINLSRATKLKDITFRHGSLDMDWIIGALRTITPNHRDLRQITIYPSSRLTTFNVGTNIRLSIARQWLDLDRLLVQFWESRSIRTRVGCVRLGEERETAEYCVGCLLPEAMGKGIVDLVERREHTQQM